MSTESTELHPQRRSLIALDALNVFLADVRDGLGPYLAIDLTAKQHWDGGQGERIKIATMGKIGDAR